MCIRDSNCCIHLSYDIKITVQVSEYVIHLGLRPRWISVILLDLHNSSNHNQPHSIIVVSIDLLLLAHRKVREVPTTLDDRLSAHTCNEPVRTPAYALKAQHPNIATWPKTGPMELKSIVWVVIWEQLWLLGLRKLFINVFVIDGFHVK